MPTGWFWCLYCLLWTYFTPCSSASIVNFEQVNTSCTVCASFVSEFVWKVFRSAFLLNSYLFSNLSFYLLLYYEVYKFCSEDCCKKVSKNTGKPVYITSVNGCFYGTFMSTENKIVADTNNRQQFSQKKHSIIDFWKGSK